MLIFGKPWHLPPAWGDIPTWFLAVGAGITAWLAGLAFQKQSREVRAIEQQVKDGQTLAAQQGEQLELQRQQFADQRALNEKQSEVLQYQADELRASVEQRRQDAEAKRRAQAEDVFLVQSIDGNSATAWISAYQQHLNANAPGRVSVQASVVNSSGRPVYDVELLWHLGSAGHGEPNPEPLGTLLPHQQLNRARDFPGDTNMEVSGAAVRFTDVAGVRWLRRIDGYLGEVTA
jgi:hypothetical protein